MLFIEMLLKTRLHLKKKRKKILEAFAMIIARLSQGLWTTTTPKNFYHPNQLSTRCVVESFNFRLTVPLGRQPDVPGLT